MHFFRVIVGGGDKMMDPTLTDFWCLLLLLLLLFCWLLLLLLLLFPFSPSDPKEALVYGLQDCGTAYDFID